MQRTESISVEEDESVKVNFYEGEPSHDIMIDGIHPTIVRAYTQPDNCMCLKLTKL